MRRSIGFAVALGALPLALHACGGTFITSGNDGDGGPGGQDSGGASGAGTGGRSTGGRASTGGRSTGGRIGAGGFTGAGGLIGPGGFMATGGLSTGGYCSGGCHYLDDECHTGTCLGDICQAVPVPDGQPCEDGSLCTTGDTCRGGFCSGGASIGCAQPSGSCQVAYCDPSSGSCSTKPGPDDTPCFDSDACTTGDVCRGGVCKGTPVGCGSIDGCCPANCTPSADMDCTTCTNLALTAVATHSGGGSGSLGPSRMNDGVGKSSCEFTWVFNDVQPSGAWIQLSWTDPITIGSIYIETEPASGSTPVCSSIATRNLGSGVVQYFSLNQWHDVASFTGFTGDVTVDFGNTITTNQLRVFDMTATSPGYNSVIYEWRVYAQPGCM